MAVALSVLLSIAVLGQSLFAAFEVETPAWQMILRWALLAAITLGLARVVGHWAIFVPILEGGAGAVVYTVWRRRHGFHPCAPAAPEV